MITASHNPPQDNGIKIIDCDGGMLTPTWEPLAEEIANVEPSFLADTLHRIANSLGISDIHSINRCICLEEAKFVTNRLSSFTSNSNATVLVGRDTRTHSAELSLCVERGITSIGGRFIDL